MRTIQTNVFQKEILASIFLSEEANNCYNQVVSLKLDGDICENTLEEAVYQTFKKHPALQTVFSKDGLNSIFRPAPFPFEKHDLSLSAHNIEVIENREADFSFDLFEGPLIRFKLIKTKEFSHTLILSAHHVVCDGWSIKVLLNDIEACYRKIKSGEYQVEGDGPYVVKISPETKARDLLYWKKRLKGAPERLELDRKNVHVMERGFRSERLDMKLLKDQSQTIMKSALKHKVSPFEYYLAKLGETIRKDYELEDFILGICLAGQIFESRPNTVGHFVRLLPIRFDFPCANFEDFLERSSQEVEEAKERQSVSYGELLSVVDISRRSKRVPLINFVLNYENANKTYFQAEGVVSTLKSVPRGSENFEIFLNISNKSSGCSLECQYNTTLFREDAIKNLLQQYSKRLLDCPIAPS